MRSAMKQSSGEQLRERRKAKGLTQTQVADLAKIRLRQYQRFESQERELISCSALVYLRICKALDFEPFHFLLGQENEQRN